MSLSFTEFLLAVKSFDFLYLVVETKYTKNHIERLMPTCKDRGRIKWISETKVEAFDLMNKDDEALRSHIDVADLYPRLYFLADSFLKEFDAWLSVRRLSITLIEDGWVRINKK